MLSASKKQTKFFELKPDSKVSALFQYMEQFLISSHSRNNPILMRFFLSLFFAFCLLSVQAQKVEVLDTETKKAIPFVFAPKFDKREYLRELEAILKTVTVN